MSDERPTFGSLFAGIGGIDLGLERAGWRGRWQVEYEPYCQRVLAKHWPDVTRYGDIREVDWSAVEPVDAVVGGFPCQPISAAGKQLAQADERWLWPEFARCLRELRPRYVLVENVANLLVVNDGSAFGEVLGDLAALGYDAEWEVISAADVGAPHRRDRVWIVANDARQRGRRTWERTLDGGPRLAGPVGLGTNDPAVPVADALRQRGRGRNDTREHAADVDAPGERVGPGGDGDWWSTEPDVGRVAHGVPARVDRLRALGNAVVPQVVEFIGRRIIEAEGR